VRQPSRHHRARTHGAVCRALASALAATTALVAPAIVVAGGVTAQTVQPLPAQTAPAPNLGRVINGLVVLDDPTQVRPGGWTPVQGVDTSRAPIVAGDKPFADALQPFLGQPVSVESFNRLITATVLAARHAGYPVVDVVVPDPTNTSAASPRTDVTAASLTLGAGTGIGLAAVPLVTSAPLIAAVTGSGGINIVNDTHATPSTATTLGATSGNIEFIQNGGGNLTVNRATDGGGNITIDVRNADLTVTTATTQNGGNIVLGLGSPNNLTLNGTVTASGSLLGRALRNVSILGATLGSGTTTTLIVDDAFPAPPGIGPGSFIVNGGTITTQSGQELSLFLARRSQVTIGTAPFVLNGNPFDDDAAAKQAKDQKDPFVHFGVYFAPTVMPDASPFTVFFKELLEPPPPDHFENEIPLPLLNNRSFPVAFGMLYQQGPAQNAGLAGAAPGVQLASLGTVPGYARISSYDVAPDVFSAINRTIYMDVENPKTEELLGYELRPSLEARLQPAGAGALPGIEPAGGTAMSCSELPALLPILDNPELAQNLRDLCARRLATGADGAEQQTRPARFYRVQR